MRIGMIGSGKIGATAGRLLTDAGHEVAISNSRGPASLDGLVGELGERARAATVDEASSFGDVTLVAIPSARLGHLHEDADRAGGHGDPWRVDDMTGNVTQNSHFPLCQRLS